MCARKTAWYKEERCVTEEEIEPQHHLCKSEARVILRGAELGEEKLHPERQAPESPQIKEEEEPETRHIKEEEREGKISQSPLTGVFVKSEAGDGERRGGPQTDGFIPPLSEEYEEDIRRSKESERQRGEAVRRQPRDELHAADISDEDLCPEQQEPKFPGMKAGEEPQTRYVKEEERDDELSEFLLAGVGVKGEEGDGGHFEGLQSDGLLAPLSESDGITSHSSDDDDDEEQHSHGDSKREKCSQCDATFFNESSLERHARTHTGEKPFACSVCGKRFSRKATLATHTRTHTGEKPYSCSVCGKTFTQKGHLIAHARTHSGEKAFACSLCAKRFSEKKSLTMHARTHTGEKPFACSICGKRFSAKENITRHSRTHSGEKPFPCAICGQRFSIKTHLTTHTRTHTGEKPFACVFCCKRFSRKASLTTHTRTHTGEKPFGCGVCDKRFYVKREVKRHKCPGETRGSPSSCSGEGRT